MPAALRPPIVGRYTYDDGGNVTAIADNKNAANHESFGYDHRERLTSATYGGSRHGYSTTPPATC